MLTQLNRPLVGGQSFPLSLRFEKAGTVEATVMVKATVRWTQGALATTWGTWTCRG